MLQPYRIAKDLRTRVEVGDVDRVLDGDLDPFIRGYLIMRRQGGVPGCRSKKPRTSTEASNYYRGKALNEPETIRTILEKTKTIAVVGLTDKPDRPSFLRLQIHAAGRLPIIPIHPTVTKVLGEKAYPTLNEAYAVEGKIDLVDVFRASEYVPEVVKDVMRLKIPYLWLQEGVCHEGQ